MNVSFPPRSRFDGGNTEFRCRTAQAMRSRGIVMRALARRMLMDDVVPWKPLPDILASSKTLIPNKDRISTNHQPTTCDQHQVEVESSVKIPVYHSSINVEPNKSAASVTIQVQHVNTPEVTRAPVTPSSGQPEVSNDEKRRIARRFLLDQLLPPVHRPHGRRHAVQIPVHVRHRPDVTSQLSSRVERSLQNMTSSESAKGDHWPTENDFIAPALVHGPLRATRRRSRHLMTSESEASQASTNREKVAGSDRVVVMQVETTVPLLPILNAPRFTDKSTSTEDLQLDDVISRATRKESKSEMLFGENESELKRRSDVISEVGDQMISDKNTSEKRVSTSQETAETIPRFYYPRGKPNPESESYESSSRDRLILSLTDEISETVSKISKAFKETGKERLTRREMDSIADVCGLTSYWKAVLFKASCTSQDISTVTQDEVVAMWKRISKCNHDNSSKFVAMLAKPGNSYLDFDDFLCLMQDIVECHPGLLFLREAPEFHTRYINTVVARIFYMVNRSWSGQITVPELRKSNFLQVLDLLSEENDINAITDYFSYEHFYVVYCKFWELDTDHDLIVNKSDLARHGSGVLPIRLIERLLCGAVTRWDTSDHQHGQMSYVDFVWFLISEEDKTTSTSIEYWFRCMDLDGDGFISMYEMEYFYEEQVKKLEHLEIEALPFEDCVCQMLDMVKPALRDRITLRDLKQCKLAKIFFDTFFNIGKYLEHEQKDPFAPPKDGDYVEVSDWVRFATEEYELLVAEEHANEQQSGFDLSCSDETDALIKEEFANYGLSSDRGNTDDDLLYPQKIEDSKEVLSD